MRIVGLDLGRSSVKLYSHGVFLSFPSVVGEWRERKLKNDSIRDEYEIEYSGEKYFVGNLAVRESEFYRQMLIEEKATIDSKILALTALHELGGDSYDVVTGLPVYQHDNSNKNKLISLLQGRHKVTVNGITREFDIRRLRVSVECGGAFWSEPKEGLVRLIDGGSKTINYVTMDNKRYIDRDSGTLTFGFETNKSTDITHMANKIVGELGRKWSMGDKIYVIGGSAKQLVEKLINYFPNTSVFSSKRILSGGREIDLNLFANAVGYFNIGSAVK